MDWSCRGAPASLCVTRSVDVFSRRRNRSRWLLLGHIPYQHRGNGRVRIPTENRRCRSRFARCNCVTRTAVRTFQRSSRAAQVCDRATSLALLMLLNALSRTRSRLQTDFEAFSLQPRLARTFPNAHLKTASSLFERDDYATVFSNVSILFNDE